MGAPDERQVMPRRATIKDVAALAGVSLKTVSRVINREPGVSEAKIARVQGAVAQLDYRHNLAASNLRRGHRTQSIGVLLHDHANAFSATVLIYMAFSILLGVWGGLQPWAG